MYTLVPWVPKRSHFEAQTAISKPKKYNLPGTEQILTYLVQEGSGNILFGIAKNCLISRSLLLCQFTRKCNKTYCNNCQDV
jgi:hypothetical protein